MQLMLDGKTLDGVAIERLKAFEPPEGYYLAFSGGKDSICIYDLAVRAKVKFDAHYNVTGIDPPELVKFIKVNYPTVIRDMPEMSIWRWIEKKGLPTRVNRWCCEKLKERGGHGRRVVTGIRWAESNKRSKRQLTEACYKDKLKVYVNPIIDWQDIDVWQYINERNLEYCCLYNEGFKRIGCIMCPMAGMRKEEGNATLKFVTHGVDRAFRYFEGYGISNHIKPDSKSNPFKDKEEYWNWWLSGKSIDDYLESQEVAFE